MCGRKALAITGSESHSLRAPGRVARRNKRPLELHASGGLFFLRTYSVSGACVGPRAIRCSSDRRSIGQVPKCAAAHMKGKNQMTDNKKLQSNELASVQGGGAKRGAKPSGLAKASSGRVKPKAVNLGAKKR